MALSLSTQATCSSLNPLYCCCSQQLLACCRGPLNPKLKGPLSVPTAMVDGDYFSFFSLFSSASMVMQLWIFF